ncbi:hypothetical protein [Pantanalinema sp. GBBB05]|uniref:hypothetical protein n=1 Tax=Pantanalinema sp. GBBB05 TaxID=2604139 RepID=UPI001DFDE6F5|nr:hypothetical protein [Pantanalinema sp. GBBB05]
MKLFQVAIVALVLLINIIVSPAAFADRGRFKTSSDYAEVTQAIEALIQRQSNPDTAVNSTEAAQKLTELQLQKYILETSGSHARCTNEIGKTLAVYLKPKKAPATQAGTLYYLGNRETTDDDFICAGVYLPAATQVALSPLTDVETLSAPVALRFVEGTQLTVATNPTTGAIEFNLPPAQTLKAGEENWAIPELTQANIDAQPPNAPQD